jgi:hypothetical protein
MAASPSARAIRRDPEMPDMFDALRQMKAAAEAQAS